MSLMQESASKAYFFWKIFREIFLESYLGLQTELV